MFESVNLSFILDLKEGSLFNTFHNLCIEQRHEIYFLSTIEKYGIEVNKSTNFLYNQLRDRVLNSMLKYRNKRLIPISTRLQRVELEKSEIETLHYVAGFKVFSLKKSLKKIQPTSFRNINFTW